MLARTMSNKMAREITHEMHGDRNIQTWEDRQGI